MASSASEPGQDQTGRAGRTGQAGLPDQASSAPQREEESTLAAEQAYVDRAFSFLDRARERDQEYLRQVMLIDDPDPQARVEREVEYHRLQANLDRYRSAEIGLVFGRIDIDDTDPDNPLAEEGPGATVDKRYIGRIGLSDENDDYRTVIMDWRADGARPFYLATTAHPEGVSLRRHLRTHGRKVRSIDDERLSGEEADSAHETEVEAGVGGESVLREVMNQARTGHMRGIVETIQREQDLIIRDSTRGTLVVQGGPGTGKTAVALHRVAWLLYTYRDQLAKTGVLIIGPNTTFLDYISRVLPSLGETGVVLTTIADLYPGVRASDALIDGHNPEPLVAQEVKGSIEMLTILREAVRAYQELPAESLEVRNDNIILTITPEMVKAARTRARRTRKPHNLARPIFRDHVVELLAAQMAEVIGADPLGGENLLSVTDVADLRDEIDESGAVADILDELWPALTPEQVLSELLSSREAIDYAASDYDELTREALYRPEGTDWMPSDAPLLDELAELLGPVGEAEADEEDWQARVEEAQGALDTLSSSASQDLDDGFEAEILSAYDVIDAEALAERHRERDLRSTAERAAADRLWAYGHVIVDEAQELSAMAWRMLRRRSPNGWMTLVGDVAQTGSPAGAATWDDVLEPIIGARWHLHELTVNYRTPAEVMEVAASVLAEIDPELEAPQSIRATGRKPVQARTVTEALTHVEQVAQPDRLVAVIAPAELLEATRAEVREFLGGGAGDARASAYIAGAVGATSTDATPATRASKLTNCAVYDITTSKGLEFDEVIVVAPDQIVAQSPQGLQDLYVALTRATQGLVVVDKQRPEHLPELDWA
ncbi:AAA family ATPase [Corynebacterium amycolatum]|uniref:AAA family ATPase n=1 Tax=Corynebacterium amycolatum TaxID=43765 RepID=A0AB37GA10_CORAY|nr:AAA family ATPase [Corynebacterium amycolatum]QPR30572.1 AAA family ATPase [Corynebacterium amycolatum]QQB82408.1 AAA family ATPase [Corynebacterium amycolatum]QQV00014.1 AAA family ATPase [Corynebacterium amycolatum]